jgi:hypothetical protein
LISQNQQSFYFAAKIFLIRHEEPKEEPQSETQRNLSRNSISTKSLAVFKNEFLREEHAP